MFYKRAEYFRYTFGEPLEAKFRILLADDTKKESSLGQCALIDLSPGGAKLFTEFDIPHKREPVQLQLNFTLFERPILVVGKIVWKKTYRKGYLYGYDFEENDVTAQLIVQELKLRRRLEVEEEKKD